VIARAKNQLLLDLALTQLRTIYWKFIDSQTRQSLAAPLQTQLWQAVLADEVGSRKKIWFDSFASVAITRDAVQKLYAVWTGELTVPGLSLSERDLIDLAQLLAIKMPGRAEQIVSEQLQRISNPDDQRRLTFLAPSVSASQEERDAFFASLALEENRQVESWVLEALANLHHPLRVEYSERYLPQTLELLEEVQVTGDIFFPKAWLAVSLANYSSDSAVETVESFLEQHPDYNPQLRMKLLQAADTMFRAHRLLNASDR
jgi:aminopeptidase N